MDPQSNRFQTSRSTRFTCSSNSFNPCPNATDKTSPLRVRKSSKPTLKNEKKPKSKSKNVKDLRKSLCGQCYDGLFGLLCAFYAKFITCCCFIAKYLRKIICQKDNHEPFQEDDNCFINQPETPPPVQRNSQDIYVDGHISCRHFKSNDSSTSLFSSDSEDESLGSSKNGNSLTGFDHPIESIDDYELPLVRVIDNVIYFIQLYCTNYPAFVQEIGRRFHKRGRPEENPGCDNVSYRHGVNPKEKRPKIVEKGIEYFKKRKLKAKMSRLNRDAHKRWVLQIALVSRLLIFFIQFICTNLPKILKHENDGFKFVPEETYGKLLDPFVNSTFGGYVNWDAHYFLHISVYGYTSENILAFFPLLPMLLYLPSRIVNIFLGSVISLSSIVIVLGVILNVILFQKCADNVYEITKFRATASRQMITTACMFFCFNPASIFFSGLYTETLFAYLTSSVLLCLLQGNSLGSLGFAALSCLCRSNGILNVGFILALDFQNILCAAKTLRCYLVFVMKSVAKVALAGITLILFQMYGRTLFCNSGKVYDDLSEVPLYCVQKWPGMQSLPYSYIQKKYWNVGFLEYYQFKQIPNFILAAPVLYILGTESWATLKLTVPKVVIDYKINLIYPLFHGIHGLFLTFFCLLFVHIQVSTRMIMAACPYLYVYLACLHENEVENFRNRKINWPVRSLALTLWCILYYLIGTVGFSLGLPWT